VGIGVNVGINVGVLVLVTTSAITWEGGGVDPVGEIDILSTCLFSQPDTKIAQKPISRIARK
jgi:hypothetical protein